MQTRNIDIDIDVHKAIELGRNEFGETDNAVLRRLLGIEGAGSTIAKEGRPWIGTGHSSGLKLPHGTELQLHYTTTNLEGFIDNGEFVFGEHRFTSPSGARVLCRTKDGRIPHLNGKAIIRAKLPGTKEWVKLTELQARQFRKDN